MTETNLPGTEIEPKKSAPLAMISISVILAAILIFMVVKYYNQKNAMIEMETVLTAEKDSLANELRVMAARYDNLKTDNDSLNAGVERQKKRIEKLLSINASNIQLIKTYRAEIGTMREIMKSYIVQIDSLNTRNKVLVAENREIRQEISKVKTTNTQLEKTKEELTAKVDIASVIQAKDIVAVALNKKRKETTRLSLLDKLRVCFTLRENALATAGPKEVFLRVIRPDSLVISTSSGNVFDYKGNKLVFSANRTADYMNQDVEMCIFVDNTGDFIVGNYTIELYLENNLIGKAGFMMSKK